MHNKTLRALQVHKHSNTHTKTHVHTHKHSHSHKQSKLVVAAQLKLQIPCKMNIRSASKLISKLLTLSWAHICPVAHCMSFTGYSHAPQANQLSCHVNATECKQCCRLDICTCHPFLLLLPLPVRATWQQVPFPLSPSCCAAIFYIIYTLNVVYDAVDTFQGTAASKTGRGKQKAEVSQCAACW